MKEDVEGLDFIMALRPVTYKLDVVKLDEFLGVFNTDINEGDAPAVVKTDPKYLESIEEKASTVQTGFLAQEVEAAADKIGFDFSGVDKPKNDKDHYALRYAEFTVPLVKAVQEQQAQIKTQKEENEALKAMLLKMQAQLDALQKQVNTPAE